MGAGLRERLEQRRPHALTAHLHQTEAADLEHLGPGAVALEMLAQLVFECFDLGLQGVLDLILGLHIIIQTSDGLFKPSDFLLLGQNAGAAAAAAPGNRSLAGDRFTLQGYD